MTSARSAEASTEKSPVRLDDRAPVLGASEITIAADPQAVWEVLTEIDRWPSWNADVKSMSIEGPVVAGTEFRWKAGPGTITSTVTHVEPPRLIAWTGVTFGIKAVHLYRLEPRGGDTIVRTEESYEGLVAGLFRRPLQKTVDKALADGLRYLKAEVERTTSG